jgi:hypothetical protein
MAVMNETAEQARERNSHTEAAHKRETFWQITLPLIVGLVVVLTLAVLAVLAATGTGPIKQAGDASLIFLICPLMLVTILFAVILGAVAYGLVRANRELPFVFYQLQDIFERVRQQVQVGSDKAVEPVLKIRGFFASLGALKRK